MALMVALVMLTSHPSRAVYVVSEAMSPVMVCSPVHGGGGGAVGGAVAFVGVSECVTLCDALSDASVLVTVSDAEHRWATRVITRSAVIAAEHTHFVSMGVFISFVMY